MPLRTDTGLAAAPPAAAARSLVADVVPPLLIALIFAAYYAQPVADIDVWWHLAAGRWIVANGQLPSADPFGVFGAANPVRTATVLKGQWLGQVILYATFSRWGALGLVVLRAALLSCCVALTHVRARRLGADALLASVAAVLVGLGLLGFTGDRPQLFSIALAAVLMSLVEAMPARRWPALAGVAAVACLWANLHGGVLIGVAVLGVLAAVDALRVKVAPERSSRGDLALAAAVFTAGTLLSPNGLVTYVYVLQTQASELAARTSEYASALRVYTVGGWERQVLVYATFAAGALALYPLARRSPSRAAALVFLAAASAASYRYHAFFLVMATPWVAAALAPGAARLLRERWRRAAAAAAGLAIGVGVLALHAPLQALRDPFSRSWYPVDAVERVRASGLRGTILSWFGWSGYVLWELAPDVRPFLDPRMLDDGALRPYTHMLWATPEGVSAFDGAGFTFVLLPFTSPTGEIYPLHRLLRSSPGWELAYAWGGGALYRRSAGSASAP